MTNDLPPLPTSRDDAVAMDARDELAPIRDLFELPPDVVYLDGNSLGALPRATQERVGRLVRDEWGTDLIASWNAHDWIGLAGRVAAEIAPLIGADADEVAIADSTSVNLFKLLVAGLRARPGRSVILSEKSNFPTDLYVAQGVADLLGERAELRLVDRAEIEDALDESTAVLMLTHVDFRTGEMHDIERLTAAAHGAGALVLWDLAHSAGAVPVDLDGCGADLAVGCGYKYLNGGPGAPAFAYVAHRHQHDLRPPVWGWMGHAQPFDFSPEYRPAEGIARLQAGTPSVLALAALACGVATVRQAGIDRLREKSVALGEMLRGLVARDCAGFGLELASPREPERRGSQVSFRHPEGYAIIQALIAAGVIGDFRTPDILRFGLAPAYVRFVDVWDAAAALHRVLEDRLFDRPELRQRRTVT